MEIVLAWMLGGALGTVLGTLVLLIPYSLLGTKTPGTVRKSVSNASDWAMDADWQLRKRFPR